jgi:hypothetical protein
MDRLNAFSSDPVDSMTREDREHTLFEPALFSACGR